MDYSLVGGQDVPKKYELWSLRFILASLGIILLLIGVILTVIDTSKFPDINFDSLMASSILTLIGAFLIYFASLDNYNVAEFNNLVLLFVVAWTSVSIIWGLVKAGSNLQLLVQGLWFDAFYWIRLATSAIGVLTTGNIVLNLKLDK